MTLFAIIAVCTVIDFILSSAFIAAFFLHADEILVMLGLVLLVPWLVQVFTLCLFWHRAWRAIQDGCARTTPAKAVGFMFIPFFNFYWAFRLIWGFAKDYNAFCQRHRIDGAPRLPERFFLTVTILSVAFMVIQYIPIIGIVYGMALSVAALVLLYQTARAVMAVQEHHAAASQSTEESIQKN